MIQPLNNAVIVEDDEDLTPAEQVDIYSPDPYYIELTSVDPDVLAVGQGDVVGMFGETVIIKTYIKNVITPPEWYKVPKLTYNTETDEYDTEWLTPTVKEIVRKYYVTYDGVIDSPLVIGDHVLTGNVIGTMSGDTLRFSVTTESGYDIHPYSI